jgi:hypothetical protein
VEEEPPKGRGPRDRDANAADQEPRRRKRRVRKNRQRSGEFSIIDSIPLDYSLQINLGVGIGFLLQLLGAVFLRLGTPLPAVGLLLLPVATVFWLWGCAAYAKNKGYPELVGAVGLIGCLGLIILILLPHRSHG